VTRQETLLSELSFCKHINTLLPFSDETFMVSSESCINRKQTPFENIEGALEYVTHLSEASLEAKREIEKEIPSTSSRQQSQKTQALHIAKYKLTRLDFHLVKSQALLSDLRELRQIILEEREPEASSVAA
jgi:hypothetical protein